jgi:hypothetical protein
MRTTLHNHKFIDSEEKPLIKNEDFKKLVESAQIVFRYQYLYSLTPLQKNIIDDILLGEKSINRRLNHPEIFK